MKFLKNSFINQAPLHIATDKCNIEIVKLLLERPEIDINIKSVLILICLI